MPLFQLKLKFFEMLLFIAPFKLTVGLVARKPPYTLSKVKAKKLHEKS